MLILALILTKLEEIKKKEKNIHICHISYIAFHLSPVTCLAKLSMLLDLYYLEAKTEKLLPFSMTEATKPSLSP